MLYYLGLLLETSYTPFNVLTYYTVRAGGAAVTAFVVSLAIGPTVIRLLRSLKIGQYIKKEHVADLHALLAALKDEGCNVVEATEESEQGKFGWVIDPEGNKVELWEPPAEE